MKRDDLAGHEARGPADGGHDALREDLDRQGFAVLRHFWTQALCDAAAAWYDVDEPARPSPVDTAVPPDPTAADPGTVARYRSRVLMERHGFGRGEYKYFAYPLPAPVAALRESMYGPLSLIANDWNARLGIDVRYPPEHATYLERCRAAGQARPTPLLLKYGPGDYNCLHQDLYGEHVFPLQMTVLLSEPGHDFEGGEFVMTEQRPRMQSRPLVVPLQQGDAVVLPVHHRPVNGTRGVYRVNMRHGVSEVRAGRRFTLGIIFHDAT